MNNKNLLVGETLEPHSIQCFDKDNTEVLRIQRDGDVIWKGRKVESDAEFRAAMIDLADVLKANIRPSPSFQDLRVAGLIEALRYIGHDGEHNLNHLTKEEMARQALEVWEASK